MHIKKLMISLAASGCLLATSNAFAQEVYDDDTGSESEKEEVAVPSEAQFDEDDSTPDPDPKVPGADGGLKVGIHEQAGTGGTIAYGEAGVFEIGGAGRIDLNSAYNSISLRPTVGWFVVNNIQLSASLELNHLAPDEGDSFTSFGAYVEPSLHLPFTNRLLGFAGLGAGVNYNQAEDFGFALRPRIGLDVLIGRSGILRPALELTWATVDVTDTARGTTITGVTSSFGASFAYSVMF